MFKGRWSNVVTVSTVNVDQCRNIENQNGLALFFDPYEKTDDLQCEYAQMAQAAEKMVLPRRLVTFKVTTAKTYGISCILEEPVTLPPARQKDCLSR